MITDSHVPEAEGSDLVAAPHFGRATSTTPVTQFVDVDGGRIAYESVGEGPLVVLSHGIGDVRQSYRFLAPLLGDAGYRVVSADLRGHGESSLGWGSISRSDVANDLIAIIRAVGGPAVIIGQSLSGGAATIAAARSPELVSGVVELNPFTRVPKTDVAAMVRVSRYRRGGLLMAGVAMLHSLPMWLRYLDVAYPTKPADWAEYTAALKTKLSEPGRMKEFGKTLASNGSDAEAELPHVSCPALIIMGSEDPDFPDPKTEGEAIVAALPKGRGTLSTIDGAGHYLHAERPSDVAALVVPFLRQHAHA